MNRDISMSQLRIEMFRHLCETKYPQTLKSCVVLEASHESSRHFVTAALCLCDFDSQIRALEPLILAVHSLLLHCTAGPLRPLMNVSCMCMCACACVCIQYMYYTKRYNVVCSVSVIVCVRAFMLVHVSTVSRVGMHVYSLYVSVCVHMFRESLF